MPTHVFRPTNDPPTLWDRLLVHPLDNTVAAISVLTGLTAGLSVLVPGFQPSAALEVMPWGIIAALSVFLVGGGIMAVIGLHWMGDTVSDGWALERFGWLVSFAGFIVYTISIYSALPGSMYGWGLPLVLGLGCALRVWAVIRIERSTRRMISEVRDS